MADLDLTQYIGEAIATIAGGKIAKDKVQEFVEKRKKKKGGNKELSKRLDKLEEDNKESLSEIKSESMRKFETTHKRFDEIWEKMDEFDTKLNEIDKNVSILLDRSNKSNGSNYNRR